MYRDDGDYSSMPDKLWRILRPLVIYAISIAIVGIALFTGYQYVMNRFLRPVDKSDGTPVIIEVKPGSSTASIASLLYGESESNRLIRSKAVFKVYVDFVGAGSKLRAGTYEFNRSMTYGQFVDQLMRGDGKAQITIKYTLTEGMTAEDMAGALKKAGVIEKESDFLDAIKKAGSYKFELPEAAKVRKYALEGYLFPDTYEVYKGSGIDVVINKMLVRFNDIFTAEYMERANELGMTIDDVVTLASIIEREAKTQDFAKVSAVFHNRLKEDTPLQSCATVQYALGVNNYVLSAAQLDSESKYNTYKYEGLPVGPISNPGKKAIEAALYPDEEYVKDNYLYFCLKEPESGELLFAKTLKQHEKNVSVYKELWLAYDQSREDS